MNKLASLALLLPLAAAGCTQADSASPDIGDEPVEVVEILEKEYFENLDKMVASSDAVIIGEVLSVAPGEIRGVEDDGTGGLQFAETTVRVESVIAGALETDTVVIESLGWADYGRHFEFADGSTHHVHTPGERAIFHLVQTQRPDDRVLYRLTNSQGKYIIDGAGALIPTKRDDALASRISQLSVRAFEAEVATMATRR